MRILLVHNFYKITGGEDTVFNNEKRMLERHGHDVFTYTRDNHELDSFNVFNKAMSLFEAVYSTRTYRDIIKLIKDNDIDLIHVHNTQMLISPSIFAAARDADIPVFQTVHNFRMMCLNAIFYRDGQICEDCIEKGMKCGVAHKCYRGSGVQSRLAMRIQMAARTHGLYKHVNFICLTDFNASKLQRLNKVGKRIVDSKRIFVKPNFIPEEETKKLGFETKSIKDGKNFIYVGRLDKAKGIDTILKACKYLKDGVKVRICGSGPDEEWCRTFAKEEKLENIEFLGNVEHSEVLKLLAESDASLFMSKWYEGFPMTIIESFSVGTPMIGLSLGNGGSIISDIYGSSDMLIENSGNIEEKLAECMNDFNASKYSFDADKLKKYTEEENYNILMDIYQKGIESNNGKM
ncbi:MAG: glycosyltransferase family 4 protein [Lachnospiraceae bacterium]|nr:glycosyltransferase family 4 protein [Lachnospiraceae bacterium]